MTNLVVTDPHAADVIHTLSYLLIETQRTLFKYRQRCEELEGQLTRINYDAETARIHAEESRINEYEMWGPEGRPF